MGKLIQFCTRASRFDGPFGPDVGWPAAGMGYFVVTDSGRIIAIDGGHPEDAEDLLSLMESHCPCGIPEVDLWIITHPHRDHHGALTRICSDIELRKRVKINRLCYYFPNEYIDREGRNCCVHDNGLLSEAAESVLAQQVLPTVDQCINVDGTEVRFLFTPTDCSILNRAGNANLCSLIFTVKGSHRTAMFTGDAYNRNMQIVVWRYPGALKCDILQAPHHGLCDTANAEFYRAVSPEILLVPISAAGDRCMHSGLYADSDYLKANLELEDSAKEIYKAYQGHIEITL